MKYLKKNSININYEYFKFVKSYVNKYILLIKKGDVAEMDYCTRLLTWRMVYSVPLVRIQPSPPK